VELVVHPITVNPDSLELLAEQAVVEVLALEVEQTVVEVVLLPYSVMVQVVQADFCLMAIVIRNMAAASVMPSQTGVSVEFLQMVLHTEDLVEGQAHTTITLEAGLGVVILVAELVIIMHNQLAVAVVPTTPARIRTTRRA